MLLELKKADTCSLEYIHELFENNEFYFGTKRPETLTEGHIRRIVLDFYETTYSIFYKKKLEGLIGLKKDDFNMESLNINIRCRDMNLILNNLGQLNDWLINLQKGYKYLKTFVFDFDNYGKILYNNLSFQKEAILKEHTFKFNKYHDVIIFSKKTN